jgi:hypothetical protein
MTGKKFFGGTGEAVYYGWASFKANGVFFAGVTLFMGSITSLITGSYSGESRALAFILVIIGAVLTVLFRMGLTRIFLNTVSSEKEPEFIDIFSSFDLFASYLFGTVLYVLIVLIGSILFVVPGIILGIRYCFFGYFIIDKRLGAIEALKASDKITEGIKWDLLGFLFVLFCVNILGGLAIGFGMLATVPATCLAFAYAYCNLITPPKEESEEPSGGEEEKKEEHKEEHKAVPILNARKPNST